MGTYNDTLTNTDGNDLSTHTADSGQEYLNNLTVYKFLNNRLYHNTSGSSVAELVENGTTTRWVSDNEFDLEIDQYCFADTGAFGICFCAVDTSTFYMVRVLGGVLQLYKFDSGVNLLGSWTITGLSPPQALSTIKVEVRSGGLKVYYGVTERISSSDTALTRAGFIFFRGTDSASTSTGYHLDSITYTDQSAASPTITGITASVKPNDTLTVDGTDLDTVTSLSFGPVTISSANFLTQTAAQITVTVPDAYDNGLAFGSQTVTVTDGTTSDSTTTTLATPTAVTHSGTVSGYDALPAEDYSIFDDSLITVVDGDDYIAEDPTGLVTIAPASGAWTFSGTGSVWMRALDVSDTTASSQGTWTDRREIAIVDGRVVGRFKGVRNAVQTAVYQTAQKMVQ